MKTASNSDANNRLSIDRVCRGVIRRAAIRPGPKFLKRLASAPKVKGDLLLCALRADRCEAR
jgi:hypothetical protein